MEMKVRRIRSVTPAPNLDPPIVFLSPPSRVAQIFQPKGLIFSCLSSSFYVNVSIW
ncbi:UNVERIFIED_CONTAM: hypothetical protein Slati_3799500 [Sesamum latifolium]|uniref:Uncharacterized protein n=1 Tax=Sesamum latifolium TaxID=2727402 RepID=A0AAW2U6B2_9LAMI